MPDVDAPAAASDSLVVLRISSNNVGTRGLLGILVAIVGGLTFIALRESAVWIAVALFAPLAAMFGSMVLFPYAIFLELNQGSVRWTRGRFQTKEFCVEDVASIVLDFEGNSELKLTSGERVRLPDDLFAYSEADLDKLSSTWIKLWPGKPVWLRNRPNE